VKRVFSFNSIEALEQDFDEVDVPKTPGLTFVVLEVDPFSNVEQRLKQPPFDGPELKYRFGRFIERQTDCNIFGYRL
jgi:sulfopyruvate decarboxylase subunit beta